MVFTDGKQRSIDGVLKVFRQFARLSGLQISVEKSTIYMAGISQTEREAILANFLFASGQLPVRYLGLPLLTKCMTVGDYKPLIEKIRGRISSWTIRQLSYAGRLQLIRSVLMSITNFWMNAYRLPSACVREIEKLCAAFLWSGPSLNTNKSKVAWNMITRKKTEGGLGLRPLKEVNTVSGLKLIWRLLSPNQSLWKKWVFMYLIRKDTFWSVGDKQNAGSWMWRKILKFRPRARDFHRVEVKSGSNTSFWYDHWSSQGRLIESLGVRECIDLGIPLESTLEDAFLTHRRRRHRHTLLNRVEEEIENAKTNAAAGVEDVAKWMCRPGVYKDRFKSKETWMIIREHHLRCDWSDTVWFKYATPKYSFLLWTAMHDRLATGDCILYWNANVDTSCSLCHHPLETRQDLFFECAYAKQVCEPLVKGILTNTYTCNWDDILRILRDHNIDKTSLFILRYVFQATIYGLWRERNAQRHGENPSPPQRLIKVIDKTI
ncbi:uncharacterized protein LOC112085147 [Eutrema salsugineum]|uniref:uncharacterized protein LOC112085147 n=1 Tax=Eutrema salsugineum TaxID=72664 RepID=UPI000CED7CF7|nr:uncharacterized protein LOC112085147 [Eutrema salsugineum]